MADGNGLQVDQPTAALPEVLGDRASLGIIAMERTRMPMVVADATRPDLPIVFANQAFLNLTGYTAPEVLGRNCRFMQGPESDPKAIRHIRERLSREETIDVELLNYRKDGSSFWNAVHLSPVHDQTGRLIYYFGSQWDVSERHRAETLRAVEHRLLREVDHRAMNALALVQGFVRLSRRDTVEGFVRAVEGRVEVLARTHTMLARSRWADVTLETVFRSELTAYAGPRAQLAGPMVLVDADRVQALALLVHELAANAVSHGALARPEGRLEVSWRLADQPGVVELAWRERGVPALPPGASGFGLRLIGSIVRQQLQGQLNQHWSDEGLTTEVRCRIAR